MQPLRILLFIREPFYIAGSHPGPPVVLTAEECSRASLPCRSDSAPSLVRALCHMPIKTFSRWFPGSSASRVHPLPKSYRSIVVPPSIEHFHRDQHDSLSTGVCGVVSAQETDH